MVRFTIRGSRMLATGFVVAHAACGALVFTLQVGGPEKAALLAAIAASLAHALYRHAFMLAPQAVVKGVISDGARMTLTQRNGRQVAAGVLGTSYVSAPLTVLNLRVAGALIPRHVLLVRDNVDPEEFRKMRVRLRWRGDDPATPPPGVVP